MNDDNVFLMQDTATDIPLNGSDEVQEEVVDPRRSHQYCLNVHERRKKFLSKVSSTPHKLLLSSREESSKTPFHSNAHNYEMINNPRDTPFFSLHGPEYDEVATYFDPRRTRTTDILGKTIYQQQVFVDTQEEIPATNDVLFESFFTDFYPEQMLDLEPLDLDNTRREDGELSQTFSLASDSPKVSSPNKKMMSIQDDLDDYRDLLIDVLVTKNPIKMSNTLKASKLLQKVLTIASPKDVSPEVVSNGDQSLNSFVDEKSVVGDKSLPNTPKVPVAVQKKSALLRLASDPNHSFIDEFDRSLQPSSSSTPRLKPRSNALSKRKKTDQPNAKSEKSNKNKISSEQLNKRQKIDKDSSTESPNVESNSMSTSPLTPLKPSLFSGCESLQQLPQKSGPDEPQKDVEPLITASDIEDIQNIEDSTNVITAEAEITAKDTEQSQSVPKAGTESNDSVDRSKESASVPPPLDDAESDSDITEQVVTVEENPMNGVKLCEIKLPVDSVSASKEILESSSPNKTNYPAKRSDSNQTSTCAAGDEEQPNRKPYCRDVCNLTDPLILKETSRAVNKQPDKVERHEKKRNGTNLPAENVHNAKDSKLGGGSKTLLDAGLMSIRQIKGTDHQDPTPLTPSPEPENADETVPQSTVVQIDDKLKPLAFKDRAIGKQLMKYCSCWIEETKHTACVDLYGEFLVTINNRYCQQLDMSVVNAALSVLSRNSDRIDPDNFILKTALFTTQLLKVLTYSNQTF